MRRARRPREHAEVRSSGINCVGFRTKPRPKNSQTTIKARDDPNWSSALVHRPSALGPRSSVIGHRSSVILPHDGSPMDLTHLIAALSDPAAYPHPVEAVQVCQTHISAV